MRSSQPHRFVVPESSRQKSERLLPQMLEMPLGEQSLDASLRTLSARIRQAETNHPRSESFYLLQTRTETVLKDILQLAMLGDPATPSSYQQQQLEKLTPQLKQVLDDWRQWSQQWEHTLPGAPQIHFGLDQRNGFIDAAFSNAYSIVQEDRRIDAAFEQPSVRTPANAGYGRAG